ncbi:MAG: DUF4423 domain-containing protein [Bdellovibrionota bacterium]
MNVFTGSYKAFLKFKAEEARGALSALAQAAKCQSSYLLRVIHEEAQLTPDQAFRLCSYWVFSSEEQEYFMGLVNHERSSDPEYRKHLRASLDRLLDSQNNLQKVVEREEASEAQLLLEYHSEWEISLLHFLAACKGYQTKEALARRARLSPEELESALTILHKQGLIEINGQRVKYLRGSAHIPKGSAVLPVFLSNWRARAVQKSQRGGGEALHFTNVQTIGKADLQKLLDLAKQFIQKAKETCDRSASEEVVAVNLDVFIP